MSDDNRGKSLEEISQSSPAVSNEHAARIWAIRTEFSRLLTKSLTGTGRAFPWNSFWLAICDALGITEDKTPEQAEQIKTNALMRIGSLTFSSSGLHALQFILRQAGNVPVLHSPKEIDAGLREILHADVLRKQGDAAAETDPMLAAVLPMVAEAEAMARFDRLNDEEREGLFALYRKFYWENMDASGVLSQWKLLQLDELIVEAFYAFPDRSKK